MTRHMSRPAVSLLTNMVSPYRVPLFKCMAESLELSVLYGGREANRTSWKHKVQIEGARTRQVWGWQISTARKRNGKHFDHKFIHIEPGYLFDLLRDNPAAVITGEMGLRTILALAYGSLFRRPVWVWWGGTVVTERDATRAKKLSRKLIAKWAKHWLSYGATSTEYLRTLGIPAERIVQIQNCVDESAFISTAKPALNLQPRPVLLHVGQMIARKGIAELLRAAARLQNEGLSFSLLLVGDGPDTNALKELSRTLRLRNIHFFPAQPVEAMPALYASSDVLVFPTMEDVWGLVANEAVLCGLPVLCSKYAGCAPELFEAEAIFDPLNPEEFVIALRRAVTGNIPPPDRSKLLSTAEVARKVADAVRSSITRNGQTLTDGLGNASVPLEP